MRRHRLSNIRDLFVSLVNGTPEELRSYIAMSGDVNLRGPNNCTLLIQTILNSDTEKATMLIDAGCDVNLTNLDGATPIHLVMGMGDNTLLSRVLTANADVNQIYQHVTPLMLACRKKDYEAAELLITLGPRCCVNLENYFQETALSEAIVRGANAICKLLLQNSASVQKCYYSNFRFKISRKLCNNYDLMETFLTYGDKVDTYYHLLMSCVLEKFDVAELILGHIPDPFVLKGLGLVIGVLENNVWEGLSKRVIKPYKLATKCSRDNKLLTLLLELCKIENPTQKKLHKQRACFLLRLLVNHGLVLHPQTSVNSCEMDCECRKCIFTAVYACPAVTSLKAQCCSQIRQQLASSGPMADLSLVDQLHIPTVLKEFICFDDW